MECRRIFEGGVPNIFVVGLVGGVCHPVRRKQLGLVCPCCLDLDCSLVMLSYLYSSDHTKEDVSDPES